jgi:hypothetical protein
MDTARGRAGSMRGGELVRVEETEGVSGGGTVVMAATDMGVVLLVCVVVGEFCML